MACTFVGVMGDFWTKRAPFVCPKHMQSSRRNPTYHKNPLYIAEAATRQLISFARKFARDLTLERYDAGRFDAHWLAVRGEGESSKCRPRPGGPGIAYKLIL